MAILFLAAVWDGAAQGVIPTIVTIRVPDPVASESGDPGLFVLRREGLTNMTLNVFCVLGGTASNGVDYVTIPNIIPIPTGMSEVPVPVVPIDDTLVEGPETVTLTLVYPPVMPPINYLIGSPSNGVVTIFDNDPLTNQPPIVHIATPPDGAKFPARADIPICAEALDLDGYVVTAEFFADAISLGIRTNLCPACVSPMNPFCLVWSNVPPGNYILTAKAADNDGASSVSAPVNIAVLPPRPPPTNFPPVVRIIGPPNGSMFRAPVDVPLFAFARDPDDAVATVEFFAGTNSLGLGSVVPCPPPPPCATCPIISCPTNVYALVWSNAPVGMHVLRALATDTRGATGVSEPVNIAILPSPPPPTNVPPIVSIVATDPIAIEGTNCWPWLGVTNATPAWSNWIGATPFCRFFTNCGPKNATFVVRRFGLTNDDLTVNYAIGGTASNGVDYVTLPGSVTILAGERRALITIVPIDDGPPDITSTVVLKLKPDPNYLVGFPGRAAALILDSDRPRLLSGLLPDRCFHLNAAGPDGAWFHIECSTDLLNWTPICINQVINGSIDFVDPDAQDGESRFYRAVPEAGPPPD